MLPYDIPAWVGQYIGLPFAEHGRDREGVDCFGLLRLVYREQLNIALPAYVDGYDTTADVADIERLIAGRLTPWRAVQHDSLEVGDAVLMRVKGHPAHIGIAVARGRMLHVERTTDSCIEWFDRLNWCRRVVGFYRFATCSEQARNTFNGKSPLATPAGV